MDRETLYKPSHHELNVVVKLLEKAYLSISYKLGWNPINCYYYSYEYNVCYGAPILVGNANIWRREGLFEELNRLLKSMGYQPLSWENFKEILKLIERPSIVLVNYLIAPNGKVEPHDISIFKPLDSIL